MLFLPYAQVEEDESHHYHLNIDTRWPSGTMRETYNMSCKEKGDITVHL